MQRLTVRLCDFDGVLVTPKVSLSSRLVTINAHRKPRSLPRPLNPQPIPQVSGHPLGR